MSETKKRTFVKIAERGKGSKEEPTKDRLLIVADSHGKDLSYLVEQKVALNVSAVVRGGADFSNVTFDLLALGKNLTKKDHLLLIAGTNNTEKCEVAELINEMKTTIP